MAQETLHLHRTIGRPLDKPQGAFDLGKALADLRAEPALEREGRNAIILHKEEGLKIVLMALRKGNVIHEHQTAAPITVQVLEGAIRFTVEDQAQELRTGRLLTLHAGLRHGLEALEDSAVLLTLAGPRGD